MYLVLGVALAIVGAFLLLRSRTAEGEIMTDKTQPAAAKTKAEILDDIFKRYGAAFGVDWRLSKAVAIVESSLNANAVNEADNESIGLMQILCRPDGHGGCRNEFYIDGWNTITRAALFDPDTNIKMGTQILAYNIKTYGMPRGVAVYNSYSARSAPTNGPFPNQIYVDRVMNIYQSLSM